MPHPRPARQIRRRSGQRRSSDRVLVAPRPLPQPTRVTDRSNLEAQHGSSTWPQTKAVTVSSSRSVFICSGLSCCRLMLVASHSCEEICFLPLKFLWGENARVAKLAKFLKLVHDIWHGRRRG
jgi:hypothetical protein